MYRFLNELADEILELRTHHMEDWPTLDIGSSAYRSSWVSSSPHHVQLRS